MIRKAKNRRLKNQWEAHYDPNAYKFQSGNWKLKPGSSATNKFFRFENIHSDLDLETHSTATFTNILFFACDFEGDIGNRQRVVFKKCRFVECDFEKSILDHFKFSECRFERCSFTLADMGYSEFRDCRFKNISVSGNETPLLNCYITNPKEFMEAIYLSKSISKGRVWKPTKNYKFYLETKAKIARSVLHAHKKNGSESEFYSAVNAHEVAQGKSRVVTAVYGKNFSGALFHFLQYNLIRFMGYTNSWGKNPALPIFMIIGVFGMYSFLYLLLEIENSCWGAMEKSFNVSIIAGYNFALKDVSMGSQRAFIASQFVLSLVLYTSFFSTLVGRLSRVK